jgi:hypothetical protein
LTKSGKSGAYALVAIGEQEKEIDQAQLQGIFLLVIGVALSITSLIQPAWFKHRFAILRQWE